ncbi:MAG: thioester dehydrase [Gammaproteobacteria bacterium]|nr:thioester dehydrase [Gammaproteobacteria bacterium]
MSKLKNTTAQVTGVEYIEDGVSISLHIPATLDYFNGHFPQAPILAGVVQLDWAVKYAKQYLSLADHSVKNVEILKFKLVMTPGMDVVLTLTKKSENKFGFAYSSDRGIHASGRVVTQLL